MTQSQEVAAIGPRASLPSLPSLPRISAAGLLVGPGFLAGAEPLAGGCRVWVRRSQSLRRDRRERPRLGGRDRDTRSPRKTACTQHRLADEPD